MPKVTIALVQAIQSNGVTINSEYINQNDMDTARGNLCRKRTMTNTSRIKVSRRKTVSVSNSQQNITSVVDIERNGPVVRFQMSSSFPTLLPVLFLTFQTPAHVANVADNCFPIIAAATDISFAPLLAYTSRMRFVG